MDFAAKCAGRLCRGGTHKLITSFHGKIMVATCRRTCRFYVPLVTQRNFGTNTTQENKKNFQAVWLEASVEINFKRSVQKKFSSKTAFGLTQNKSEKKCMPICHATSGGVTPPIWGGTAVVSCHFWGGTQRGLVPSR